VNSQTLYRLVELLVNVNNQNKKLNLP